MKMNIKSIVAVSAIVSMALSASYVNAENKGPNIDKDQKSDAATSAFSDLALAERLISYGDKNKDSMALILAAKIKKSNPSKEVKREKTSEGGNGQETSKADKASNTAADVLTRARKLAGKNKGLLAEVDLVSGMKSRGHARGPQISRTKVRARRTDVYRMKFKGRKTAAIVVNGDHDTDLDLFVYDNNGNRVCSDTDSTDTMICRWRPRWTGTYTVKIKNYGKVYNRYTLRTN